MQDHLTHYFNQYAFPSRMKISPTARLIYDADIRCRGVQCSFDRTCIWMVDRRFFNWYKSRNRQYPKPRLSDFALLPKVFPAALGQYPWPITMTALSVALEAGIEMAYAMSSDIVAMSFYKTITRPGVRWNRA